MSPTNRPPNEERSGTAPLRVMPQARVHIV
jgi:hypothetical protein